MTPQLVDEFLRNSNAIEQVDTVEALEDARDAWDIALSFNQMTVGHCLSIHYALMRRLERPIAGNFRNYDVRIGWQIKKFRSHSEFATELEVVFGKMNTQVGHALAFHSEEARKEHQQKDNVDDLAKLLHVDFENIHPFPDGNGRTGRIIYNWHRAKCGMPLHIIHEGAEQMEYYKWFR